MKILVVGASGLVGAHVLEKALERGHQATGTSRGHSAALLKLDLSDAMGLGQVLDQYQPDVVASCTGWTLIDGCERDPDTSYLQNYQLPLALAKACQARKIRLLQFSTSYVFDGKAGPYAEGDAVSPINVYGWHKAASEDAVREATAGDCIIARLSWVWGADQGRKHFAYQVMRSAEAGADMAYPADQLGNPTWAGNIAEWSVRLLEGAQKGVWHLAADAPMMSRHEWAEAVVLGLRARGLDYRKPITPSVTSHVPPLAARPLRCGLSNAKVLGLFPLASRRPHVLPEGF